MSNVLIADAEVERRRNREEHERTLFIGATTAALIKLPET